MFLRDKTHRSLFQESDLTTSCSAISLVKAVPMLGAGTCFAKMENPQRAMFQFLLSRMCEKPAGAYKYRVGRAGSFPKALRKECAKVEKRGHFEP